VKAALDTLRRFVQALRLSSSASEREVGLPAAQLFVLRTLGRREGLSLLELAAETRTDPSSVSVVVKRLEERRLVARRPDPHDRRRIRLALSARGRALLAGAPHPPQDALIAALEAMSAAERKRLVRLLERLTAAMGGTGRRPSMFFEEGRPHRR
jgi:DNA-binding MarR family transcriptional regulator